MRYQTLSRVVRSMKRVIPARRSLRQRGATLLPMAVAGLLGTSVISVPLLDRAISSLDATKKTSSVQVLGVEAAAWYALWRLEHDPTIHTEFTGSPPTTTFQFRGADITIVGVEPPDNSGIILSMSVTPNSALPDDPTLVTYTLVIKNDDDQAHEIVRLEADPAGSFSPSYIDDSTTGLTTVNPTITGGRLTWTPVSTVTINPFGAQLSMSWDMVVDESDGNYWMDGEVRIDGVGDIEGLTEANVLVTPPNDVAVTVNVTPVQVEAGESETFNYTVTVANNGSNDYNLTDVKFWATKALDVVAGTSSGISSQEPQRNSDMMSNARWEWTWGGLDVDLDDGEQVVQTFDMTAALPPGTWFAEAAVKTEESTANGQEVAATSSSAAPIKAVRVYDLHVDIGGTSLDIEALLDDSGIETLSWIES